MACCCSALSSDVFDSISDYVITKQQLCGKIITVTAPDAGVRVMGFPICIEDKKYHRNALLFNVAFILAEHADVVGLQPLLRKLALTLRAAEIESEYLHKEETRVGKRNARLPVPHTSLPVISLAAAHPVHPSDRTGPHVAAADQHWRVLRCAARHACGVAQGAAASACAAAGAMLHCHAACAWTAATPDLRCLGQVKDFDVPVQVRDLSALVTSGWELTLRHILPFLDGVHYVKRIAMRANVDVALVRRCVQHLVSHKCVMLLDIFQFSNVYAVTPRIAVLAHDAEMQHECIRYVSKAGRAVPPFRKVFALYCALHAGMRVTDLCRLRQSSDLELDEHRLITFGLIHGFVRRVRRCGRGWAQSSRRPDAREAQVHKYPVRVPGASPPPMHAAPADGHHPDFPHAAAALTRSNTSPPLERGEARGAPSVASDSAGDDGADGDGVVLPQQRLERMLDGSHSLDAICCELMVPKWVLDAKLRDRRNVAVVMK